MKRSIFTSIVLLAAVFLASAEGIPQERAAAVAEAFFSSVVTKAPAGTFSLVATYPEVQTKAQGTPALYVFERSSGGYVVVSGDDVAVPVVGYAHSGRFPKDDMPVNMRSVLDWHAAVIGHARSQGWMPSAETMAEWDRVVTASSASSSERVVLETARWGQGAPFNALCPKENGQDCPTGCVATAMAIIMRYYEYPEKGTGTLPGYDYGWNMGTGEYRYHLDGYDLGHTYRWDLMPLSYSGSYTQEEADQVAQLMYDLGIMSQMDYAPGGSGAPGDSPILLAKYFGYDKQMRYFDRIQFSDARWEQLIRDEIDASRPVFHCGFSDRGGHAFVVDGYEGPYFRINYGWGGSSQFYLLTPPVKGSSDQLTEFTEWQDMVVQIMPDRGGEAYVGLSVPYYYAPFTWNFLSKSFLMDSQFLWNDTSTGSGDVVLCYALFDKNENFKAAISDPVTVSSENAFVPEMSCRILDRIDDGDRILLARRDPDGWTPLPQSRVSYRIFDRSRKLPEMVTVGHSMVTPAGVPDYGPYLYLESYKDVWWEVWSEEAEAVIVSARDQFVDRDLNGGRMHFERSDDYEAVSDTFTYRFYLPSGHYKVTFRNFDEELVFKVTF